MNVIAGRHGELDGHLDGYTPELVARAIWQTAALGRRYPAAITYLLIPDEATYADGFVDLDSLTFDVDAQVDACLAPWRIEAMMMTAYCLRPAGHDTTVGLDYGAACSTLAGEFAVLAQADDSHGWFRLADALDRGEEAMAQAAARIEARAAAATSGP